MRHLTLLTIILLSSLSTMKGETKEDKVSNDTIAAIKPSSTLKVAKIDFLLESLLEFDSETELENTYGDNVEHSIGNYPEGMGEYQNTLLFPGTKNQVEFVWRDDSVSFSGLAYINLSGHKTDWGTLDGITLGTKLKELEKLNRKPFTFKGFGWDYGGVTSWDNGYLEDRKVFVSLGYPGDVMPPEFEGLLGDHEIKSNSELAQKANPIVVDITMMR